MIHDYASSRSPEPGAHAAGPPETVASLAEDAERFNTQRESIRRYCYAFLRNEDDAEDAVQLTLERALRYGTMHKDGSRWLIAIARNVCRDLIAARRGEVPLDDEIGIRHGSNGDPEHQVATRHALVGALEALTPTERRAVGASWLLDQTSYDAARSVGLAHQTLRVHLARARKKLALYLDDLEQATAGFLPWLLQLPHRGARRLAAASGRDATWTDRLVAFSAPALALAVTIASVAVVAGHSPARTASTGHSAGPAAPLTLPHPRDAVSTGAASAAPSGSSVAPADLVGGLHSVLSPGRPGDAYVDDVQPSPNYSTDHTLFASATDSACQGNAACGELFVSHDAGHTWTNLQTIGLQPHAQLLLPAPSFASGVFYAFGAAGLQMTTSAGKGFATLVADLPGYAGVMPPGSSTYVSVANVDLWNFAAAPVPGLEGAYLPGMTAAGSAVPVQTAAGWTLLQPVQGATGPDSIVVCGGGGACQVGGTLPWSGNQVKLVPAWTGPNVLALVQDGAAISYDAGRTFKALSLPAGATVLDGALVSQRVVLVVHTASGRALLTSDDAGSTWHSAVQSSAQSQPRLLRQVGPDALLLEMVRNGNPAGLAGYDCSGDAGTTWGAC